MARARVEVDRVGLELAGWLKRRRDADVLQQYRTQFAFLEAQLGAGLQRLGEDLGNLRAGGAGTGRVYRGCREVEVRLAWLERVWGYFRRKFDQREGVEGERSGRVREVLLAADEVVWSCYAAAFVSRKRSVPTAPLPYLEPLYTPNAQPRTRRPPELEADVDQPFMKACLESLPIPVLGLPWACVEEPWWLVLLAHEVGHHVQHDGGAGSEWVTRFAEQLEQTGGDVWFARGEEVFADFYSVLCCGTAPIRALVEFVLDETGAFHRSARAQYPSARVRLALMLAWARRLGLSVEGCLPDYVELPEDASVPPGTRGDLDQVGKLVEVVQGWAVEGGCGLETLVGYRREDFGTGGTVETAARSLARGQQVSMGENLSSARLAVAAGARVWAMGEARVRQDEAAAVGVGQAMGRVAKELPGLIRRSRVQGTRAGVARGSVVGSFAEALSRAPMEELT